MTADQWYFVLLSSRMTENKPDYEEQFAHRFSADDATYQQYRSRPADPPPIVENWSSRGRDHR